MIIDPNTCTFCGYREQDINNLIKGKDGLICHECVMTCLDLVRSREQIEKIPERTGLPSPQTIKAHLDEYIVGQDNIKKILSVAVYNHYKRVCPLNAKLHNDIEIDKSNILLIGPTGSGKTLFAQSLAKALAVPFASADATALTEAGYVGEDVENIIQALLANANYDVKAAELGIVYIDEIDKLARRAGEAGRKNVSDEGVQQALLKLIEGTVCNVPDAGKTRHSSNKMHAVNTRNILFICGGAFSGLEEIINKRNKKSGIGFNAAVHNTQKREPNTLKRATNDDLISYGLIPEFIGRLPIKGVLSELNENTLISILTEPKNAIIKQYQRLFLMDGVDLTFTDDALHKIAQTAITEKAGARGLRSQLEQMLLDIMYDIGDKENNTVEEIIIDSDYVAKKYKELKITE